MIDKQLLASQSILECLKGSYGLPVTGVIFLPLGADAEASIFKAIAGQSAYFVKAKRGYSNDVSTQLLPLLQAAGITEIIPPVPTKQGSISAQLTGYTITVFPFIEAKNGFERPLTDSQWVDFGKALKKVHRFNVPSYLQSKIRREDFSPKWREAVTSLYKKIDTLKGTEENSEKLLAFLKVHQQAILHLVDRAAYFAEKIKGGSADYVLCHGDIHAGNLLICGSGPFYIVDFDDPIMAPKERDLMFIGGGIANVWNDPRQTELFYKGYGECEINQCMLAYYRYERIVEDIAVYAQELILATASGKSKATMVEQFMDMFKPKGVIEMARNTEKGLKA